MRNPNTSEVVFGTVEIPLDKLETGKDHEQWHQISDEKHEAVGQLLAKVHHDELVILPLQDYQALNDLLHDFDVGLTAQIALAIPSALRKLAETFLNIFQVSGQAIDWLKTLVEDEIDGIGHQTNSMRKLRLGRRLKSNESATSASDRELLVRDMGKSLAGEANLLFRGNSLLTQSLDLHMRRLGKEYLEDILCDKIVEINDMNPDCEVDPSRIQNSEDLHQHWVQLLQLTSEVWGCIATSAARLPPELRQVLKYVRAVAEEHYGDFLRTVTYTSVSGFLFLRFICPAVLNPKLFGLLRDNPRPRAQRTLTLIAKGLQALANLATFGKKESWMEPMNKFLGTHRQPFKDLIDQICTVPADRQIISLPASYSTPITILGRLSPTSREGSPSLPYLIDHAGSFASLIEIWLEANHANNTAETYVYEGELGQFNSICIELQKRSDECLAKAGSLRTAESTPITTDELTEAMDKKSLADLVNMSYGGPAWMENDPYRAPGSSGSEKDGNSDRGFFRIGREGSSLRQISDGSDISSAPATMRIKKGDSRNPRSFLSGLIGKKGSSSPSTGRDRSRDKDKHKDKEGGGRGLLESWASDNSSRPQ
jgi:hypothetical protein